MSTDILNHRNCSGDIGLKYQQVVRNLQ